MTLSTGIFAETGALTSIAIPVEINPEIPGMDQLRLESGRLIFNESVITAETETTDPNTNALVLTPYNSNTPTLVGNIQNVTFYINDINATYDAQNETYTLITEPIRSAIDTVDVNYSYVQLLLPFDFEDPSAIAGVIINGDSLPPDLVLDLQDTQRNGESYYLATISGETYYMIWQNSFSPPRWRIERLTVDPETPELFYENLDKKCNLVFGNILDKDLIQNTIRKYNIEICFHM
jgi:hypothetical protein